MAVHTTWLLEQWARWRRFDTGIVRGYPSQTPFRRKQGSTFRAPQISDPVACYVDHAVAQFCQEDPRAGRALCCYFLDNMRPHQVAERLRCHRATAERMVRRGVSRVEVLLDAE